MNIERQQSTDVAHNGKWGLWLRAFVPLLLLLFPTRTLAQFTPYQADGFAGPHPTLSAAPDESVDPLSGNLISSATDLVLPGNAGFDLVVQRFYSSQIFPDYESGQSVALEDDQWAGLGWRFHFGRVLHTELTGIGQTIVELPGGGGGPLYHTSAYSEGWMTKGFARYNRTTNTLKLPNGLVYIFGQVTTSPRGGTVRYVTEIDDPYGNKITFTYCTSPGPADGLASIRQYLSATQYRDIAFTYNGSTNSLATMVYAGRTWTYNQTAFGGGGRSILNSVTPPAGPATQYSYDGTTGELTTITAPAGGTVTYTYQPITRTAGATTHSARVVTDRRTGGQGIPAAWWTFAYDQNSNKDTTVVREMWTNFTTEYRYLGIGVSSNFAAWAQGVLAERGRYDGLHHIQSDEQYTWVRSEMLSSDDVPGQGGLWSDPDVYNPLLSSVATTLGSYGPWTTTYSYHTGLGNFNDFGNAYQIVETGDRTRTTTRTFQTGFTPHILGRIATAQVQVGGETVSGSWTYDLATGFQLTSSPLGVTTTFTKTAVGNIATAKDARNNTTSFSYNWGAVTQIQTPMVTQTRTVNSDGTPATVTVAGLATTYYYDSAGRLTTVKPPGYASCPSPGCTTYSYAADGRSVTVTRDTSQVVTTLDGFGRTILTSNSLGVKVKTGYTESGAVSFQSAPYTAGSGTRGTSKSFDALGRVKTITGPDGGVTTFSYQNGNEFSVKDPLNRTTWITSVYTGTHTNGVLAAVLDPTGTRTIYTYNVLDTLVGVGLPGVPSRSWSYDSHNWLFSDTQPESGTTTYEHDANGNTTKVTKANTDITVLTYDANNNLTGRDGPGTDADVTISYDTAGRVYQEVTPLQTTTYTYDAKGRLASRQDVRGGLTWTSGYQYDDRGNLTQITYPSGRVVVYTYDAENRLTGATQNGVAFAGNFVYGDNGRLASYNTGPVPHGITYDTGDRVEHLTAGTGGLDLTYEYNTAGEVKKITDPRAGMTQTFTYDLLSRLETANGPWGYLGWTYDAAGNRKTQDFGAVTTYTYDQATQRLASTTGAMPESFGYNTIGQLTSDGRGSYSYNGAGLLATATSTTVAAAYGYDAEDERITHTVNGATTYTVRGVSGQTLTEYQTTCGTPVWTRDLLYAGGQLVGAVKATLTQPAVSLVTSAVSANENAGTATVTVRLTTPGGAALGCAATVGYASAPGTASPSLDYTSVAGTLLFPAGTLSGSTQTITVPVLDDALDEDDETLSVALNSVTGAAIVGAASAIVTIVDDDPMPTLTIGNVSLPEGDAGTTSATLTATLSAASGRTVTVNYATADGTATTADSDYTATSGAVTIVPGMTTQTIAIPVLGDLRPESDESLTVALGTVQNATPPGTSPTVTIQDDDHLGLTLTANKTFPLAAGQTVTWTATATKGSPPYTYQFAIYHGALGTWRIVQDYGSTNTFTWTPFEPGTYQVRVWVKNNQSQYDGEAVSPTVTITAAPAISLTGLSANVTFPAASSTTETWTATAAGGVGPLQYKFLVTDSNNVTTVIRDYAPLASATWVPCVGGTFTVQVQVRSAGSTAAYDATLSQAGVSITGVGATPISLTPDTPFPLAVGTTVTWTATVAGAASPPLVYRFLWRPTSTSTWTTGQAYSSSRTWTWTPPGADSYVVRLEAKRSGSPAQYETFMTTGTLTVSSSTVSSVALTQSETFPLTTQTPITFTASATGGTAPLLYQFQVQDAQTGTWSVVQPYSLVRNWVWTPPRPSYGAYVVQVWVKSTGAAAQWEASTQTNVSVTP